MLTWQSMETAPKNGKIVILLFSDLSVSEAWWSSDIRTMNVGWKKPNTSLWLNIITDKQPSKQPIGWVPFPKDLHGNDFGDEYNLES